MASVLFISSINWVAIELFVLRWFYLAAVFIAVTNGLWWHDVKTEVWWSIHHLWSYDHMALYIIIIIIIIIIIMCLFMSLPVRYYYLFIII